MFQAIVRLHNLRLVTQISNKFLRKVANIEDKKLIDKETVTKKTDLRDEWKKPNSNEFNDFIRQKNKTESEITDLIKSGKKIKDLHASYSDDDRILDVYKCVNISTLFKKIRPNLPTATPKYFEAIYDKIIQLGFYQSNNRMVTYNEFCEIVKRSPIFKSFLDQTFNMYEYMSIKCLVSAYQLFSLINLDPNNRAVRSVVNGLTKNINELGLDHISILFRSFEVYSKNPYYKSENYLKSALFKLVNSKISKGELLEVNLDTLIFYLNVFCSNKQITESIVKSLVSSVQQLTFRQSIILMNKIKRMSNTQVDLTNLIMECNTRIFEFLSLDSSEENIMQYLQRLHRHLDREQTTNLYDYKLMNVLSPLILNLSQNLKIKHFTYNFIHNFGNSFIFNENLLKFCYDNIINEPQHAKQECFNKFGFFTRFRFPFVDSTRLAKVLFQSNQIDYYLKKYPKLTLITLSEFVIQDLTDEYLINLFIQNLFISPNQIRSITYNQYRKICLANAYLSMFSGLNEDIKIKISEKFRYVLEKYSLTDAKPLIQDRLYKTNSKLQANAYLSNGILIDAIAIYDKSTQQLVSMKDGQDEYFHKIDECPLKEDQEILTFIMRIPLKGNVKQYEYNYNYQLKKILRQMNIKTVEFSKDVFTSLSANDRISFLIDKALQSYNTI